MRTLIRGLALLLLWPALAAAAIPARETDDMALGRASAPVTVIEYASVGCPHCAAWANTVWPAFEKRFVATGRVRFVLREEITGEPRLAAAGFLLARCAGPAKYFAVVGAIFRAQPEMFQTGDAFGPLKAIAASAGLNEAAFKACLEDKAALDALVARARRHAEVDGIDSTPTFVVGGRTLVGDQTLDSLATAILAAKKR